MARCLLAGFFRLFIGVVLALPVVPAAHAADRIDLLSRRMQQDLGAGNYQDGLAATRELLPLVRRKFGPHHANYAAVLHNQAMFLHNLGHYREAVDRYLEALAIKERNNDAASLLRTETELTQTYIALQRFDDARAMAERALATATKAFGPGDLRLSDSLKNLGLIAKTQERYKDAEGYFDRALAILNDAPASGGRDRALADTTLQLGDLYGLEGRFDDGERLILRGQGLLESVIGPGFAQSEADADVLHSLGNLYADAGRYSEAIKALSQSVAIGRARLGDAHPNVVAALGDLAQAYQATSRFAEAEPLYEKVLAAYERVFGPDHPTTAIGLEHLANLYFAEGRFQDAGGLDARVLAIREKAEGAQSPDVAGALQNLGVVNEYLGNLDKAAGFYNRALQIMEQRFGRDAEQSSKILQNLGELAKRQKRFDEAADDLSRSLAIDEKFFGEDHKEVARDLLLLASADMERGANDTAHDLLDRALTICEAHVGPHDVLTMSVLLGSADLAKRTGDWDGALAFLRKAAADATEWMRLEADQPQNASAGEGAVRRRIYPALVEALWHAPDHETSARTEAAFSAIQQAHETRAGAALGQMAIRFAARNDAIGTAIRRQQDLVAGLAALDRKIARELGKPEGRRNDELIAGLRAESARKQKSLDEATARIGRDFPAYRELANPEPLSIARTQALLRPDEALFAMSVSRNKTYVFVVTRDNSAWQEVDAGRQALAARVKHLRKGLYDDTATADAPQPKFDLQASYDLYKMLFGPVESVMAGKSKLLIVPDGALTSLPFHVLVTRPPDAGVGPGELYRKAAWLLRDKAMAVLPAVSSLRALRVFAKASHAPKPFIGFGDPRLKLPGQSATRALQRAAMQPVRAEAHGGAVDMNVLSNGLEPLPETADELHAIAKAVGAGDADVHLRDAATVTNVETGRLDQYKILDFATHGLVAGEVSGLAEPALVLSLPAQPTPEDDGLLTASRIAGLKLDADWAVLSACNTAAGETPGAEGLSGLARAFFYAGARALLVSHWPVDSAAAVKLTTRTFAELGKDPKIGRAEAFRRAMLALIDDPSSADNADPGLWAPFIVVGDGS